jgi:DNA-binding response OmpR family regulator
VHRTSLLGVPDSTVLVVDDDPVILKLLEVNFEMEGFTVLVARDGEEGIEVARRDQPDLVVSDIMMPKVSGLELVTALKSDPTTSEIPIILLSAKAQNADVRSGLEAGADDYVTKPFEPLDLVDRVNRLLEARASKRPS